MSSPLLTTHTLHTHLTRLKQDIQRYETLLATAKKVTEVAAQVAPSSALARQLFAGRRAVQRARRALPLLRKQTELAARLAYEIEAQTEIGGLLTPENLLTVTQMVTLPAAMLDVHRYQSIAQSLDRMLALLTQPVPKPAPFPTPLPSPGTRVRVERVVDGDTIVITGGWKVRYIGMDTPELHLPGGHPEPFAREATQANETLVGGQVVTLRKDKSETDRYGRLLRFVYVNGMHVNAELVKMGLAYALSVPPDTSQATEFEGLEAEARKKRKGMWKNGKV